jgi:hypothetical protein
MKIITKVIMVTTHPIMMPAIAQVVRLVAEVCCERVRVTFVRCVVVVWIPDGAGADRELVEKLPGTGGNSSVNVGDDVDEIVF